MPHRLITDTAALAAFCERLSAEPFIAIDTEFIREKTYFPQLCLVQLAGKEENFAVDPLAPAIDLSPLYALLNHADAVKVFHAGKQDIEIFHLATGQIPHPVFDTQIAAQALGFGESISYSDLCQRMLGLPIDKASRYTDWAQRPLTDRQITYALQDVVPLRTIYAKLRERLEQSGRGAWIEEEMRALTDPTAYAIAPRDSWQRLKAGNLKPKQLAALREAAAWREEEARRRNIPRGRILRDETLLEIAASLPATDKELRHIRGLGAGFSPKWAEALLKAVEAALALPPSEWPPANAPRRRVEDGDLVSLLQLLLKLCASEAGVAPRLVAGKDELEAIACGEDAVAALQGWRGEIFGARALRLIEGKLQLRWDPLKKEVKFLEA